MPGLRLQPSLARDARSRAALALIERLDWPSQHDDAVGPGRIDLTPLLIYWIQTTPASALPYLLWQFDMLSPWWQLLVGTETEDTPSLRTLIAESIPLHARRGTPGVLVEILRQMGWVARVQEGQDTWGGSLRDDGTPYLPDEGWALVRILLSASEFVRPPNRDLTWRSTQYYRVGEVVSFPGPTDNLYIAVSAPPRAVPPYYDRVGQVHRISHIADVATLRTIFWASLPTVDGIPYRVMTAADAERIRAAFMFFRREACWLDRTVCELPGMVDLLPAITDTIGAGPVDTLVGVGWAQDMLSVIDLIGQGDSTHRIPDHGGGWVHNGSDDEHGFTYRGEPIGMADGEPSLPPIIEEL